MARGIRRRPGKDRQRRDHSVWPDRQQRRGDDHRRRGIKLRRADAGRGGGPRRRRDAVLNRRASADFRGKVLRRRSHRARPARAARSIGIGRERGRPGAKCPARHSRGEGGLEAVRRAPESRRSDAGQPCRLDRRGGKSERKTAGDRPDPRRQTTDALDHADRASGGRRCIWPWRTALRRGAGPREIARISSASPPRKSPRNCERN